MSDWWLLFTIIGAIVVALFAIVAAYILVGVTLIGVERGFSKLATVAFNYGGGSTDGFYDEWTHPRPPWDRLWVELNWIKKCVERLQAALGMTYCKYDGLPPRPDIGRLHEVREDEHGVKSYMEHIALRYYD